MIESALELAAHGFLIFPLKPKSKEPAIRDWPKSATSDTKLIEQWWMNGHANSNVGILMGQRSGIVGLDIDLNHGADVSFFEHIPPSWCAKSANGFHVFYRIPTHWPKDVGKISLRKSGKDDCVTLRGNNHYFAGVGSQHPDGPYYEWAKNQGQWEGLDCDILGPSDIPLADAPDWFLIAKEANNVTKSSERVSTVNSPARTKTLANGRHDMFLATAVAMRRAGKEFAEIVDRLRYRNQHDCEPPKEDCELELANIARWACANTKVQPKPEVVEPATDLIDQHIRCVGFEGKDYYYITTSNKQLTKITGAHSSGLLLMLMPYEFWAEMFPGKNGPSWNQAASHLIHKCHAKGPFNPQRVRGAGAWRDDGKLVIHLGNRLLVDGEEKDLLDFKSKNFYRLGHEHDSPPTQAASLEECQVLLESCKAPRWKSPCSSILFAGHLALFRIAGALPWRPHGWLTAPAGAGKSTVMSSLASTMAGQWKIAPQANSTESGIRQQLEVDSLSVLFDEAEAEDRRSTARMKGIIELARQSSSDSEGRIYKGTPDGRGLEYKINSMFMLASIGVGLSQEADLSRFTVYELDRAPKNGSSVEFQRQLDRVTPELADRIYRRMIDRFEDLLANYKLLQRKIGETSTQRNGQQYGMLLASYGVLTKDGVLTEEEAAELIAKIDISDRVAEMHTSSSEQSCLERLSSFPIKFAQSASEAPTEMTLPEIVKIGSETYGATTVQRLEKFGLKVTAKTLTIANRHPALEPIFRDTPWERNWKQQFMRIAGAKKDRARFCGGNPIYCVTIPIEAVVAPEKPSERDNGVE